LRFPALSLVAAALVVGNTAVAEPVRYFAVWSYVENAPREEIDADALAGRDLGYWGLEFDGDGAVLSGTYYGSRGAPWLRLEYVSVDGRIYADLFAPDGTLLARKSTRLSDRLPRWGE
jgi:hypothetical protein